MTKYKNVSGIIPKHSSVKDKMPTAAQLETAEIAVNINTDSPFISVKCNDGSVKKISSDGGYVVVTELPASGKSGVVYALENSIVDPDEGTIYTYDLYLYQQDQWKKIGETTEALTAGENITIVNNRINADQVVDITQADYNDLPASAISSSTLYNIVDKPVLNVDEYQKKLVAGDGITIDSVNNIIDCTLDPNLYIMVTSLPAEGIENKIYLVKEVDPVDGTVNFMQYGWINDEWVEYGKTSNLQPNVAGSGITIDGNNAINAKIADGLALDANSAITASVGAGLKIDSGKVVPNIAAPLQLNASNQLTVSSSSTYTSSGNELFTRAGAYDLWQHWCPIQWIGKIPNDNATVEIESPAFSGTAENTLLLINTHDLCRLEITVVTIARNTSYDLRQSVALQPNAHISFDITRLSNTKIRFKANGACRTGIYALPTSTI